MNRCPVVCLQRVKRDTAEARPGEHHEVESRTPFVEAEDFTHEPLGPIAGDCVPKSPGRNDSKPSHILVIGQGKQCEIAAARTDTTMLHPQELWPAPEALAAGQRSGHVYKLLYCNDL